MLKWTSRIIVAFTVVAMLASGVIAQPALETKPLDEPVSVTELFPKTQQEQSLEIEHGLKVEVVEMKSGAVQLRATGRFKPGDSAILDLVPDLENRTYTAKLAEVSPEALALLGFMPPAKNQIATPSLKLFGVSSCNRALLLTRSHSGSAGVIRSTTATHAEWWYSDLHGLDCIDLYDQGATCNPASGMSDISCVSSGWDNGSNVASVTSAGSYAGAPSGSPSISISDVTTIDIIRLFGIWTATNWIIPSSEPLGLQVIYTAFEVSCPYWV